MSKVRTTILAVRAIIAVLIRQTLGWICIGAAGIALAIGLLALYIALTGIPLLWIITTLALMTSASAALLAGLIYFATRRLLPGTLSRQEMSFIHRFNRKLQKQLVMLRISLPIFLWRLLINAVVLQLQGREEQRIERTIKDSRSLSAEFKTIKAFFE